MAENDRKFETEQFLAEREATCNWFTPPPGQKPVVIDAEIRKLVGERNFIKNGAGDWVPASERVSGDKFGISQ